MRAGRYDAAAMAPVIPDPNKIKSFKTRAAFERWLAVHHDRERELWLRLYKKGSGVPSVSNAEAIEVALCLGWIDGQRKAYDEESFLQRFSPRTAKSPWSQINRELTARLIAEGRMTVHGQREIDAAKADGRWDAAYAPMRSVSAETLPDDLRAAIMANARARKRLEGLPRADLFSLSFRTNAMKTAAGRAKKIAELVTKLSRGEAISQARRPPKTAKG
jgi:uncharacterized protein YdeI (YjbR/CyaY-like superfamily)